MVAGDLTFNGGRFVPDTMISGRRPDDREGQTHWQLAEIEVEVPTIVAPGMHHDHPNEVQQTLFAALERSHELLALFVAKTQSYAFLDPPVECILDGTTYVLHEFMFERKDTLDGMLFIGGGGYCEDIGFLGDPSLNRPVYDLYREARNDSRPIDYRVLQIWRFFEGVFKAQGQDLVPKLVGLGAYKVFRGWDKNTGEELWHEVKIEESVIQQYNKDARCAVAHASKIADGRAILPREVQSDTDLHLRLIEMIELADHVLRTRKI